MLGKENAASQRDSGRPRPDATYPVWANVGVQRALESAFAEARQDRANEIDED